MRRLVITAAASSPVPLMAIGLLLAEVARQGRSIRPAIALHAGLYLQLL